jgi:hypothetical protein
VEERGGMEPGGDRNGGKSMCRRWEIKKQKGSVRIRRRREEEQMDFPKGLNANLENCRDLFVKQNFPIDLKPE